MPTSAGLLLYRRRDGVLEVLLAHPGGPLFVRRDVGSWTLPKGLIEPGEDAIDVARREFREETGAEPPPDPTGYLPLGRVRQASGKVVHAWAAEGDLDPATASSNTFEMEHPRGSGRWLVFPEVDRVAWFGADEARQRLNPAQAPLVDRLLAALEARTAG
jgi:predicted NUDIX family NTP pyrophosphohydrolase